MSENLLGPAWPLPVFGVAFGVVGLAAVWLASWDFDRRYGSRK